MSLVEQPRPNEGQNHKSQDVVRPAEQPPKLSMEHPNDSVTPMDEDLLQVLVDADDEQCLIEEAVLLDTRETKSKEVVVEPPTIPKRNTLRTSRLLDSLRLNSIESATKSLNTPHSAYLSSEEDASSTADDDSDYDYDSSSEESEKCSIGGGSQEVTARAVSVVFVGKPCMVNLASNRKSVSPPKPKRPQSEFFGRSVPPSFSTSSQRSDQVYRKVSLAAIRDLPTDSHSFLSQDPFKDSPYTRRDSFPMLQTTGLPAQYPRPPRTPTAAFQRLSKTISLARKRSRPNLKAAAASSASTSSLNLPNLDTPLEHVEPINKPVRPASAASAAPQTPQTPTTYNDILRAARRNSTASPNATHSPPATARPASPPDIPVTTKRGLLSSLSMNRRRSMRIKS
ncbi:hypothetical protein F5Y17DRAFT_389884 [Xylariaceae sp. FL0594]|nr:hypothetical protein F5Y17DRAFT_389884 [Xylariaceae sp. FL0594]